MLTAKDHPVDRISVLSQLISVTKEKKDNQRLLKYIQEPRKYTLQTYCRESVFERGIYRCIPFQ